MAILAKMNSVSFVQAVQPGIEALVASKLDKLVQKRIQEAQELIAKDLRELFAAELKVSVHQALDQFKQADNLNVEIDLTINEEAMKRGNI